MVADEVGSGDLEVKQEEDEEDEEVGDWGLRDDWIENGKKEKSEGEYEGKIQEGTMRVAAALWAVWRNLKGDGEVDHKEVVEQKW